MKRLAIIAIVLAVALAWWLWRSVFSRESSIAYHQRAWHEASRGVVNNASPPLFWELNPFRDRRSSYWDKRMNDHKQALLDLGYLTNCELRLSNQVMTRAFYSNFSWRLRSELGTNEDQVWYRYGLSNGAGLKPVLPAKDVAVWERIFRECAERYASNLPPAAPE